MSSNLSQVQVLSDLIKELEPQIQKLHYILQRTENAVQTTLNLTEQLLTQTENTALQRTLLKTHLETAVSLNTIDSKQSALQKTIQYLTEEQSQEDIVQSHLTGILMAQDFQDLTGQVINQIIQLTNELIQLSLSGASAENVSAPSKKRKKSKDLLQGPVNDSPELRQDQDDVDRLLGDMGLS